MQMRLMSDFLQQTIGKASAEKGWTAAEQTLLENAMRAIDKTAEDRWELIAERCDTLTHTISTHHKSFDPLSKNSW